MRYAIAVAMGLMLLASSQTSAAAEMKAQNAAYKTTNVRLSTKEAMTESVARIALRGTVPPGQDKAPMARADLLRLCVLLALQDRGAIRSP